MFARGRSDDSIGPYQGAAQSDAPDGAGDTKDKRRSEITCRGENLCGRCELRGAGIPSIRSDYSSDYLAEGRMR